MSVDAEDLFRRIAERREILTKKRLVLYAGANLPSVKAEAVYNASLGAYPAMGPVFDKEQPDTQIPSELETEVSITAARIFGGSWAEARLPSCTFANLAVFLAFSKPGDLLLAPAAAHGGHLSQRADGTPAIAGMRVLDLPFDRSQHVLDTATAADMVCREKPDLVMLGRSVMITADDIAPVIDACRSVGAMSIFDGSHVSGLIAGGAYPNPLALGVDIMTSSTYKTIPGRPQGLIIGRRPEDRQRLSDLLDRRLIANYDAGRLASLLCTLDEVEADKGQYAAAIVQNTRALAKSLRNIGFTLRAPDNAGFTHQLLLPLTGNERLVLKALEDMSIIVGACPDPAIEGGRALRLGTQFLTRLGWDNQQMGSVAALLHSVLVPNEGGARMRASVDQQTIRTRIEDMLR